MNIFGKLFKNTKEIIVKEQKVPEIKQSFITRARLRKGNKVWAIDLSARTTQGALKEAEYEESNVDYITGKGKPKILVEADHVYFQAYNKKAAIRLATKIVRISKGLEKTPIRWKKQSPILSVPQKDVLLKPMPNSEESIAKSTENS